MIFPNCVPLPLPLEAVTAEELFHGGSRAGGQPVRPGRNRSQWWHWAAPFLYARPLGATSITAAAAKGNRTRWRGMPLRMSSAARWFPDSCGAIAGPDSRTRLPWPLRVVARDGVEFHSELDRAGIRRVAGFAGFQFSLGISPARIVSLVCL